MSVASLLLAAWLVLPGLAAPVPPPGIAPGRVAAVQRPPISLEPAIAQLGDPTRLRAQPAAGPVPGSAGESEAVRRYVRGRLRAIAGQPARASDDIDAALRLDPGSPVLRAARAETAAQEGDSQRAAAEWEAVLALAPDDMQALIAVGVSAAAQDQHARAAALLGRAWLRLRAQNFAALSDAGRATVGGALARSLFRLGFDEAGVEVSEVALSVSLARAAAQRGEEISAIASASASLARDAGQAAARTGQMPLAVEMLSLSANIEQEVRTMALLAWAQLECGRFDAARATLAAVLGAEPWKDPSSTAIALWLLEQVGGDHASIERIAQGSVEALSGGGSPELLGRLARLSAAAEPERARETLMAAVRAGADDGPTLEAAFRASSDAAIPAAAHDVVEHQPAALGEAARSLLRATRDLGAMRRALEALPEGAPREALAAAALASMRDSGEGWRRAEAAAERWPQRREPMYALVVAAVSASDPALVERAASLADGTLDADPAWHAALAAAFAQTGASRAAEAAWKRSQALGGARGADAARTRRALQTARSTIDGRAPEGSARMRAEDALPRGDLATALSELLLAYAADRDDAASLGMLIRLLPRTDGPRAAWDWTRAELARAPNDPFLWEAYVLQAIADARVPEAMAAIDARLAINAQDTVVLGVREALLRAAGRDAEALVAARTRTQSLPPGPRRALEQAALEAQWGTHDRAVDALRAFAESAYPPPAALRAVALDLARRLPPEVAGRAQVMRRIARDAIIAEPDASLEFYAFEALSAAADGALSPEERAAAAAMLGAEAAARSAGRLDAEAWRASADFLLAQSHPREACEFVRARLEDPSDLDAPELALLARVVIACDAAVGGRAIESMALIARLRAAGYQPFPSADEPAAAYDAIAGIYAIVGDAAGAEQIMEAGLAIDPEDGSILNNLGFARVERGLLDAQTESLLLRALALRPEDASVLDSVGWLRFRQGRLDDLPAEGAKGNTGANTGMDTGTGAGTGTDETHDPRGARSLLQRAVQVAGRSAAAIQYEHLGDACARAGDHSAAEHAWREALRLAEGGLKRQEHLEILRAIFRRQLGVSAIDPGAYHDRHDGAVAERCRAKLAAPGDSK